MKKGIKLGISSLLVAGILSSGLIFSVLPAEAQGFTLVQQQKGKGFGVKNSAKSIEMSQENLNKVKDILEEERMARDLYTAFSEKYPESKTFVNIAKSEARHMEKVSELLKDFGSEGLTGLEVPGEYNNFEIQKLYDEWLGQGLKSERDAYQVGIDLEKQDILDLEKLIDLNISNRANKVFENLKSGSENHLNSFNKAFDGDIKAGGIGGKQDKQQKNQKGKNGQMRDKENRNRSF